MGFILGCWVVVIVLLISLSSAWQKTYKCDWSCKEYKCGSYSRKIFGIFKSDMAMKRWSVHSCLVGFALVTAFWILWRSDFLNFKELGISVKWDRIFNLKLRISWLYGVTPCSNSRSLHDWIFPLNFMVDWASRLYGLWCSDSSPHPAVQVSTRRECGREIRVGVARGETDSPIRGWKIQIGKLGLQIRRTRVEPWGF